MWERAVCVWFTTKRSVYLMPLHGFFTLKNEVSLFMPRLSILSTRSFLACGAGAASFSVSRRGVNISGPPPGCAAGLTTCGETNGADPMQLPPTGTAAQQAQNYLWLLRARNNGMDTGFGSFPVWAGSSAHTSYTLLGASAAARAPPAELWESHREWFWPRADPKAYGQLCWSNTSLVAYLTQRIQAMLRANPNATMVSISQNDNLNQCADAAELAIVKAEGAPSGPMIRAINTIAKAVGADFPGVLFHTLAYDYTEQPPKITKPLPSVVVQVASSGIGDPRIQEWGTVCRQIFVWDYW